MIHKQDPSALDFRGLNPSNKQQNLQTAFELLEKKYGIPKLLDVEDVLSANPDERSMMTFVAYALNRLENPNEENKPVRVRHA